MTFNAFYKAVKKKFNSHKELFLDCDQLSVQISDINNNSFYILWKDSKLSIEPYEYNGYDVRIQSTQDHLELLFEERQYIFTGQNTLNITGSFNAVMQFQKMLSFITKDNTLKIQEEIISNMLLKQDMISKDLGIIMESLHLLLVNSVMDISYPAVKESTKKRSVKEKTNGNANTSSKRKNTRKTNAEADKVTSKTSTRKTASKSK